MKATDLRKNVNELCGRLCMGDILHQDAGLVIRQFEQEDAMLLIENKRLSARVKYLETRLASLPKAR